MAWRLPKRESMADESDAIGVDGGSPRPEVRVDVDPNVSRGTGVCELGRAPFRCVRRGDDPGRCDADVGVHIIWGGVGGWG
eukprot:m.120466 g.120466  ORF g.120466 m.120466 type:complete len:81 (+) comp21843_c0_seq3:389-631(+)